MKGLPLRALVLVLIAFGLMLTARAGVVHAGGSWLDGPLQQWNVPGAAIPPAPASDPFLDANIARCGRDERPPETPEDRAVSLAGWRLFGAYQAGWGVKLIEGLAGYDGMCRPLRYQQFVFVDGVFAGTIAPAPMDARTDGAASTVRLFAVGRIFASFVRYAQSDPLCCPSRITTVNYQIVYTEDGPVLVAVDATTRPTS